MSEPDLKTLKDTPSPRTAAKRAALAAAQDAFNAAAPKSAGETPYETKGTRDPIRLTDVSSRPKGKNRMHVLHMNRALAASIAALMIGGPAAFILSRQYPPGSGDARIASVNAPRAPAKVDLPPPAVPAPSAPREARAPAEESSATMRALKSEKRASAPRPATAVRADQGTNAAAPARALGGAMTGFLAQDADSASAPRPREFRDKFDAQDVNPVKVAAQEPVSTFSIDVDTASYAFARRMIQSGQLPPKDSVRVEEFVNYFPYQYPRPDSAETPFKPTITVTPSPWNAHNWLVHVAVQGYALQSAQRPRANLVFLVDISGSMAPEDRLPLVKNALRMLVDELKPNDSVALVTYAAGSGVALEPTKIAEKGRILSAIDALGAGGSTAGAQGLQDAYRLAEANFDAASVNRVILATDGDFNVGVTDRNELKGLIERKRETGIYLSILGVGQGNYNDLLMQTLAQNGNGAAAYVDTLGEARKVLVEEASSTLFPIARDVKIQVEWNPALVSEYRLIGYETRGLRREDFNNDKVDAGDVGSGHRVTAIYEITPVGAGTKLVDDLRYGGKPVREPGGTEAELGFFKLRYKLPKEDASRLLALPIGAQQSVDQIAVAPEDVRFSVAVAAFGQLLKGAPYLGRFGYDDVIALAQGARGDDPFGYRAEFVNLARLAKTARP